MEDEILINIYDQIKPNNLYLYLTVFSLYNQIINNIVMISTTK